jgi:Predicted membrane protein
MDLSRRIQSIDIVRGLVMIIMALDHVRDLLHVSALTESPTDLNTTTPVLFFTRWITYLCAPTFVFLSGVSAYLSLKRSDHSRAARNLLLKRGLWLIILEFTLINFALWFDFQFRLLIMQVIAAIGVGLLLLSVLAKVKPKKIAIAALVIIFTHNLLQYVPPSGNNIINVLMNIFFKPGFQKPSPGLLVFIAYPLIPWVAMMLLGFACGKIIEQQNEKHKSILLKLGLGSLALFLILRFINVYGDPQHWETGKDAVYTILSFLNVTKYPPSLLFTLLFLGITFVLLHFSDKLPKRIQFIIAVYGKVPLFYYLLHLYFIRLAVFIMVYAQGYKWKDLLFGPFQFGRPEANSGISLGWVYVVWGAIVILLYPLCRWYGNYKTGNRHQWWLRYL